VLKQSAHGPDIAVQQRRTTGPQPAVTPDTLMLRHALERPGVARTRDLARLSGVVGNQAMVQLMTSALTVQRAAVKETNLGGGSLVPEVGADFRTNHMATDLDKAKALSKSRVSRSNKNTVVLASLSDMTTAMSDAAYTATPIQVPGLNWVKVTSRPSKAITPDRVTSQDVEPGVAAIKVKVRLVANDEAKLTTAPKSTDTGPILLATGVQG
jgi:hypothetical protein